MQIAGRIKKIISAPGSEWVVIKNENTSIRDLFLSYACILAAIPPISGLAGFLIFGIYVKETRYELLPGSVILWAVIAYVQSILSILISGYVIDAFSRTFRTQKNLTASMKVIVFSFTPVWLSGLFYLIPQLNFLTLAGWIYALILMYSGLKIVKDVRKDRILGYELLVYCVIIVMYYFMNLVLTGLAFGSILANK